MHQKSVKSEALSKNLILAWIALLFFVFIAYQPGLTGYFVFDDFPNIVESPQLILKNLSASEIWRAAFSGNAGPLQRPISVLSFSLNIYFGGLDPWNLKLTNIFIHLLCTLGVGLLTFKFLKVYLLQRKYAPSSLEYKRIIFWGSWLAAAVWGLHPLNLSSVLYVVQRMTSLAAFFGIMAVALYIDARTKSAHLGQGSLGFRKASVQYFFVLLFIIFSVFSKENGILSIPLIFLVEFFLFKFKIKEQDIFFLHISLKQWAGYLTIAFIAFVIFWITPEVISNVRVPNREFSIYERLLTQCRALVFYLSEFFFPQISRMSLYHDDIEISRAILQPVTTLLSIIFILMISITGFFLRKKYPIIIFSWLWFLVSHSMESSFYPLELVHEHRNYLATIGFCIAISYTAASFISKSRKTLVFIALPYLAMLFFSTTVRALEWSSPLEFSAMEAARHPRSMRANYQFGADLIALAGTTENKTLVLEKAKTSFLTAANSTSKSVSPYFGLLAAEFSLAKQEKRDPDTEEILKALIPRLKEYPGEASIPAHIEAFIRCQKNGICSLNDMDTLSLITAPVENPTLPSIAKGEILKLAAEYSIAKGNDWDFAQSLIEEAISNFDTASTRIVYSQVLRIRGKTEKSQEQLSIAKKMDRMGQYASAIEREENLLKKSSPG